MISDAGWAALAGTLGLAVGSFLNVVIYRVPVGGSVVRPASQCAACGTAIRTRHNLPVVSWLSLKGRCYDCAAPISPRYPLVELATGLLFAAVTTRILHLHVAASLPAYLYFAAIAIALALIDIDHKRLPNTIVLPSYAVTAVLITIAGVWTGDWWALARAALGAAALWFVYLVLAVVYPAGMGLGDVKLAFLLGGVLAYLSWPTLAVGGFGGFLLGALGGTLLLVSGRGTRKSQIPFGPYMLAGAFVAIFAAQPIWAAYQRAAGRA